MSKKDLPNILMIMSDEHGPMFSGTYGHPLVETPNMDRLAEMGTTFENIHFQKVQIHQKFWRPKNLAENFYHFCEGLLQ